MGSPATGVTKLSAMLSAYPPEASPLMDRGSVVAGAFEQTAKIREPAPA